MPAIGRSLISALQQRATRALLVLCAATAACACNTAPPTHALVVRHPERKCALIKFSGCALLLPPEADPDGDAGVE